MEDKWTSETVENQKGKNKDLGTTGVHPDEQLQQYKTEKQRNLFKRLHLEDRHHNKLRAADVLLITEHSLQSHESCVEEELVHTFIQKLLMMVYRARYIHVKVINERDQIKQKENDSSESDIFNDFLENKSLYHEGMSQSDLIHPMDVQMAVFHCADGFLKQLMVTKLSQCQYALPLLVPDLFTQQIEFPLWTFRQINKSWKMRNINNEIISQTQPIYKAETPMVFFFRFGSVSSSKSQLMNSLINEKHNTFFHRNCQGSSKTRVLMDGVVEITWFCSSGTNDDKFTECVAFCNLHGDAGDHEKQLQILTEMSSVNVLLLPRLDRNDRHAAKIQNLYRDRKPLICLFTEDESAITEPKKGKIKIGLKDRNQSEVSEELRRALNDCLSESSHTFRLEDVSKHSDIRIDEEDDDDCKRGREAAQQMMSLLEKKDLTEIKESFLPHQGKLWHQWSQKNKELHRPRGEMEISKKHKEMSKIREKQHGTKISQYMKLFIEEMISNAVCEKLFLLKWLRILLDEHTSADLSALHHKYDEKWSTVLKLKANYDKPEQLKPQKLKEEQTEPEKICEQLKDAQTELERMSEDLQAATFGLEHIMREISQIYESCSFVKKNKKDLQVHFSSLPTLAAEMMISGSPLELMDGDAAHVPVIWISAVLDQLIQKLGDQRVFVLSVLGLQSSGKSTMLNAMFGLQFAVSAGRCTRGAFMQLIRVSDEMKTQMNSAKDEVCVAECFSDVIRFDVQKDVKYFSQLWEGSPPMAPPNPNYCENIQELKETIMSHASKSNGIMLKDLKDRIKDLWEALLNERFVFSFRNSLEISAYRKLEIKYSEWSWSLRSAMMKTENKLHNQIENEAIREIEETDLQRELRKTSEEVEKSMSEFFENDKDKDILIQWKTSFEIKIKEIQENIVRETKQKLNEVLQQRGLKKKIDAQRTQHENTLYEKSKELALNLKDDTNDEETLKKEFDLFWEQSVKMIIRDTPAIKDIDIMRDMRKVLSHSFESVPIDHQRESTDIFTVPSYSDYVQLKKSGGIAGAVTHAYRSAKTVFVNILSPEAEAQIRSFIADVVQQTDTMIQSFNISKIGYNINYSQQITGYIKARITEHEEGRVKYVFKNEFFMDLVLSICKRSNKKITDQHNLFRETNDPVLYLKKKREEYYSVFQKYCHGAASAVIFGEIICQKLKEPIEQSIYKKTARDLADEMRSNCPSLNGNRSNLDKHILETLAEEEDFNKYMNYIDNPRDHFKSFIRDEVSQYITDKFSDSVLPMMKENIELLQQKIMKAAHESTEHVQEKSGDAGLWLKSFTQKLSDELIFSEKDFSGVKHDDVDNFKLLEDVIRQELLAIMTDISRSFNTETFPVKLDYKFRPDELLIDHLCRCCWVQCPFCGTICTNNIENHEEHKTDHNAPSHRNIGLNGWFYSGTKNLSFSICTSAVVSDRSFYPKGSDKSVPWKDYRSAGGVYADWCIRPDLSEVSYWKWFVCRFQEDLEKHYDKKFQDDDEILVQWRKCTKKDAIQSLG
uniref:VLIG-type G domain-containing protein n=1 Tax=Cyprinus carpio TaxID=7962 RepID=A0A8C1PPP2_CYPCA